VARHNAARQHAARAGAADPAPPRPASPRDDDRRVPDLDRLIHDRVRLGIISALAVNEALTFNELKALLGTTDGNLSVHARRLEDADYVACVKSFQGRVPRTQYRITAAGRRALDRYLNHMEAIIRAARARSPRTRSED
jgi:DNA-binding MarR family transcriptional regulator